MRKIKSLYIYPLVALAFFAGALFFSFNGKDMLACSDERVCLCAHTQFGVRVDEKLIMGLGKLCSFTTYFDGENYERTENIRLAAEKIDKTLLQPGEVFSFNAVVGARTEANGFKIAKIIKDGKFVPGTGGGVCQVSTTLYNAAILSGLEICEFHAHSLQVGYIEPSRDAMVSGTYFDLKFKNNRITPVYVRANISANAVTCTIYGQSDGYEYSYLSQISEVVPRPPAALIEGEEDKLLSAGRDGVKSEGYLIRVRGGVREVIFVRRDSYPAIADLVQIKRQTEAEAEKE